jgi:AcrR family transcriptional regulator
MAGVKQFDRKDVLESALAVFWSRGYEASSIQDLVDATEVNRGSLYGTFGDKEGLFLAVIDYYLETVATPMMAELSNPDPRAAIEGMFAALIRRNSDPKFPRGCLITNTSLECPISGDTIARRIAEAMGQQETASGIPGGGRVREPRPKLRRRASRNRGCASQTRPPTGDAAKIKSASPHLRSLTIADPYTRFLDG